MKIRSQKGLTFDDVLLIPQRSPVSSRQDVDTSSQLTAKITLRAPIISANMDTVTEAKMALAMARIGGIGILHRFMTVEQQVRQIEQVKRAQGYMVEQPYTIADSATVAQTRQMMQRHDVGGLVVTNPSKKLVGLVTQRDLLLAPDAKASVTTVMTQPDRIISATPDTTPEEAQKLLHEHRLEKLPVIVERLRSMSPLYEAFLKGENK